MKDLLSLIKHYQDSGTSFLIFNNRTIFSLAPVAVSNRLCNLPKSTVKPGEKDKLSGAQFSSGKDHHHPWSPVLRTAFSLQGKERNPDV